MMTPTTTAQPQPETVSTQPRKVPKIKPDRLELHHAGYGFKYCIVNAPADLTLSDLNDHPEIWALVQDPKHGLSLAEWDVVEIRWPTQLVTARVNHADRNQVVLFDIRRASKPQREVALYSDDRYEVKWAPEGGYTYYRKSDNCKMGNTTWPTPEGAKQALISREYPPTQHFGSPA